MVATFDEALTSVLNALGDWNRGNTDNIKPVIADIATLTPERGKRLDMSRQDFVMCYETAHNEETPELLYDFVTTRVNITIDIRTSRSREHLKKMENEVRRLVHLKRKGDGTNFDRMVFKTRTDLSDRTKMYFRMTFQTEVVIFAELIP
jgi:hypothetical protein|tara:strand:- start:131 stop:577 length:447 start_codon:yes stop_codon:yes gene_type:complete